MGRARTVLTSVTAAENRYTFSPIGSPCRRCAWLPA